MCEGVLALCNQVKRIENILCVNITCNHVQLSFLDMVGGGSRTQNLAQSPPQDSNSELSNHFCDRSTVNRSNMHMIKFADNCLGCVFVRLAQNSSERKKKYSHAYKLPMLVEFFR